VLEVMPIRRGKTAGREQAARGVKPQYLKDYMVYLINLQLARGP